MDKTSAKNYSHTETSRKGVALILALVVLVVLTTVVYTLSSRLSTLQHRQQYMIDYQKARYACDSAVKYAMATIEEVDLKLIPRTDSPDFSDIFAMDQQQYEQFITDWALARAEKEAASDIADATGLSQEEVAAGLEDENVLKNLTATMELEQDDPNDLQPAQDYVKDLKDWYVDMFDPNSITVPGPYGPKWPYVKEPAEFKIGNSKVTIEIEDEYAKMPIIWAVTADKVVSRETTAALETFCEWMQMTPEETQLLYEQLIEISKKKQFVLDPKPISLSPPPKTTPAKPASTSRSSRVKRSTSARTPTAQKKTRPQLAHTTDFARLMHSSLLDRETLAWVLPDTGDRYESPLKYIAMWGSQKVNINTAPRQVLEAAFTFGGDAREIAEEIITLRKETPFKNLDDLKEKLFKYSDSIKKVEPYITTTSDFLTIKVTAFSGSAKTSTVAAVVKQGKKVEKVAIIASY